MSRSGYTDDWDFDGWWDHIRYRGAVTSAFRGKRGQAFLREVLSAMDALPEKKLIAGELVQDGCACTLGTVALARGLDVSNVDPEDYGTVAPLFGIAESMAREIMYENDDCGPRAETPEQRYARMRRWVEAQLIEWES